MDYLKPSERNLLKACFEGKKAAWDSLIQRYTDLIYHSIYHILKVKNFQIQKDTIEELYQEVVLSLFENDYKKLRQFKGKNGCSLASWLRMVVNCTVSDFIRKQKGNFISLEDRSSTGKSFKDILVNGRESPRKSLEKSEEYRLMREFIKSLSTKEKLLFELCFSRELPDKEAAQILNISTDALYMRKSRFKEKLKIIVKKEKRL